MTGEEGPRKTIDTIWEFVQKRYNTQNLILSLISVIGIGVSGHMLIAHFVEKNTSINPIDSLYWCIATISTLGAYDGGVALDSTPGRLFTVITLIIGMSYVFYAVPIIISPWVEDRIKAAVSIPDYAKLPEKEHMIICGYNSVTHVIIDLMELHGIPYLVILDSPDTFEAIREKTPAIQGDAREEYVLEKAGVEAADTLITVEDDPKNVFICLTARKMNPNVNLISTATTRLQESMMKKVGVNEVVLIDESVGKLVATNIDYYLKTGIHGQTDLFNELTVYHIEVEEASKINGKKLKDMKVRDKTGMLLIGIQTGDGETILPEANTKVEAGSRLFAVGSKKNVSKLAKMCKGDDA